jgi:hypothetical protein
VSAVANVSDLDDGARLRGQALERLAIAPGCHDFRARRAQDAHEALAQAP